MQKTTTYKKILNLIIELEKDEEDFRRNRFKWLLIFFIASTLILICYVIYRWSLKLEVSKELVGVSLSSIFSYLLTSYQEDYLNQRREELLRMIYETFSTDDEHNYVFEDEPLNFEVVKGIIHDSLKSKL